MYCKHCGRKIDDDSRYCNYCGKAPLSEENIRGISQETPAHVRTPLKTSAVYNQKTAGTWQKLTCVVFGIWLLSVLMVLADWFVLNVFGYAEHHYNLLQMEKLQSRISEETGDNISGVFDSTIAIVFGAYFAIFALITVILFIKRMRGAFITGIIASLMPIAMCVFVIVCAYDAGIGDDYFGCSMELTAVPYIMIIANIASMVILLIARSGHVNEYGKDYRRTQGAIRLSVAIMIYTVFMSVLSIAASTGGGMNFSVWLIFSAVFGAAAAACAVFMDRKYRKSDSEYIYYLAAALISILMAFATMVAAESTAKPVADYYKEPQTVSAGTGGGILPMLIIYILPLLFLNFKFIQSAREDLTQKVSERLMLIFHGAAVVFALIMVFGSKAGLSIFHICYLVAILGAAGYSGYSYYQKRVFSSICLKILGAVMLASVIDLIFALQQEGNCNVIAVIALVFWGVLLLALEQRLSADSDTE